MAKLQYQTLSNRTVEGLKVDKDTVFWDRELTGFGVRIYPTGGKVYVVQARGPGGPKRVTVGRHGVLGAEQARQRAALIIARVKAGKAPVPEPMAARLAGGPTVGELARRYLDKHVAVRYKPRSIPPTRSVVNRYIVPEFGKMPLQSVERRHVTEFQQRLHDKPYIANMVVGTFSLMYRLAEGWAAIFAAAAPAILDIVVLPPRVTFRPCWPIARPLAAPLTHIRRPRGDWSERTGTRGGRKSGVAVFSLPAGDDSARRAPPRGGR